MADTTPTYIGFRTYRYNPLITRCRGGYTGDGLPSPSSANRRNESSSPIVPSPINTPPATRKIAIPKNGSSTRQREIHHGRTPATNPGAITRKSADTAIDESFRLISASDRD